MARPRSREPQYTSLVASAVRLPQHTRNRVVQSESWQTDAWRLYDSVPELRFVANWKGNMASRARLVMLTREEGKDRLLTSGPSVAALEAYFGGEQGHAEMQRLTGLHLTVAGECYHVYYGRQWTVVAHDRVKQTGDMIRADLGDGWVDIKGGTDMVTRVWTPHPLDPYKADSPVRSNLSTLREIERSSQTVAAILASRLAGNGILMLPSDISFPPPENADPAASTADTFMQVLGEAMLTPIGEPDNPAAVVPIVVTAPGENIKEARHIRLSDELTEQVRLTRDNAVKRFALGMDIPAEVLTGMSNSNHWNAWLVDEAAVKAHIEPLLAVIANAVTTGFIWHAVDDATNRDFVAADTAAIRLRPNRSREAIDLYDRGRLSSEALLRETGFDTTDAPRPVEFKEWLLTKIALGSTSPEQTQAAAEKLGASLDVAQVVPISTGKDRPDDLDNRRTVTRDARDKGPQPPDVAGLEALVFRALERAGNRLRSKHSYRGDIEPHMLHLTLDPRPVEGLMEGAWSFAAEVGLDPYVPALDSYVRMLLSTSKPHTRERMLAALDAWAGVA